MIFLKRLTKRAPRHCFAVRDERLGAGDCRFAACGIFGHFPGFEFSLLPSGANRWALAEETLK